MERFAGQDLGQRPHLAVLFSDKIGGFVVATPLLRALKAKYPGCVLDYFSGDRTAELEAACPYIDARFSLHRIAQPLERLADYAADRVAAHGPYALAVNLEADPLNALATAALNPRFVVGGCVIPGTGAALPLLDDPVDRLHHEFWSSPDLLDRYAGVLSSTFIGEIFCRLARVETDDLRVEVPTAPPGIAVPDVLVATGGTRRAKLWPPDAWERLIGLLVARGFDVGLLGGPPAAQRSTYHAADAEDYLLARTPLVDLRGKLTLPRVAGALREAVACVTVDNGIMHLAYAVGTPTVALFGASPWRTWAPALPHLAVVLPAVPCSLCEENRFRNDACLLEQRVCMESITPDAVAARLERLLATVSDDRRPLRPRGGGGGSDHADPGGRRGAPSSSRSTLARG